MTNKRLKKNVLLNKIMSEAHLLTEDLQKDVLAYIYSIKAHKSCPDIPASIQNTTEPGSYPDILASIQNTTEPRSYPRMKISIEIDALIGDKIIQSNTKDMSATGVLLKSGINPEIGTLVKTVFSLPGQDRPFKLNGTVVRITSDGIGICFSEMPPYARDLLDNLLKKVPELRP
ncbi:PilZ domain-containing protein [Desulfobacter latus]|uniref:PilZ domain-containing protein n=1 Tax=Desulfobacter latus TaxID=2292 RepID=A0A850SYC9_9BACT|nr:PilZ domain-containing protein [Desulfobacter latus]NWH04443.1 PilZ domain-containing protein [Desulfobacter latus]